MVQYIKVWDNDAQTHRTYELTDNSLRVVDSEDNYIRVYRAGVPKKIQWPVYRDVYKYQYSDHVKRVEEYDVDTYYSYRTNTFLKHKRNSKVKESHRISW
jgi:hypothetical protein